MISEHEFTSDDLQLVQGFNCGSMRWATDVNEWIKGPVSGPVESALSCIADTTRWCRVWIYGCEPRITPETLVGYASLGRNKWPLDTGKVDIGVIPFFGVDSKFQKRYHDDEESFARGMYSDLLAKAETLFPLELTRLGLHVDPCNTDGIEFWKKCGFVILPSKTYKDRETGIIYQGMITEFR